MHDPAPKSYLSPVDRMRKAVEMSAALRALPAEDLDDASKRAGRYVACGIEPHLIHEIDGDALVAERHRRRLFPNTQG